MTSTPNAEPTERQARYSAGIDRWQYTVEGVINVVNVVALLVGLTLCVGVDSEARLGLAAFLILFGPGSGLVQLVGAFDTTVRCVLVVGLSVATSTLVAELLLTFHAIGVVQAAVPLTAITGIGLLVRFLRYANRSDSDDHEEGVGI